MNKLTLEVALDPVDSGARPEIYIITPTLKSEKCIFEIKNYSFGPSGNICELEIQADEIAPIKELWDLPNTTIQFVICIACSLSNDRVLFSPVNYKILSVHAEKEKAANQLPKWYPAYKVQVSRFSVILEENKVVSITERILKILFSEIKRNNLREMNIKDSIFAYQSALTSVDKYQRFSFLFQSFEKAVNCDKDSSGIKFDEEASKLTGMSEKEIEEIRQFCDRIKHVYRSTEDISTKEKYIENFSYLALNLKIATDNAILNRINQSIDKLCDY